MAVVVRGRPRGKVGATDPVALRCLRAGRQRLAKEAVSNRLESVLEEYVAERRMTRSRIRCLATVHPSASNLEWWFHDPWSTPNYRCIATRAFGVCCRWANPPYCLGRRASWSFP